MRKAIPHPAARRLVSGLLVLAVFGLVEARGAAPRLAVIGSPELEKETLFLTAALSKDSQIEVLERSVIEKILQEQNLERQGLTARESVQVGQLLKADGLVLLEKSGETLTARVVAVDSGAVVGILSSPHLPEGAESWSALRAEEIRRLAPKLALPKPAMALVSFLRITSATGGGEGALLEESVNVLLPALLSAQPNVLVLERARLQDASAEKEMAAESAAFWNSAWVVDGSVTRTDSGFVLDLRLQPPAGEARRCKAEAPDLFTLTEKAGSKILAALGQPQKSWDPTAESRRFAAEARWAADSGLWEQAAAAVEAAVALGDDSPATLRWRWRCYDRLARNNPQRALIGGFASAPGKDRPSLRQKLSMARSLELFRDALLRRISFSPLNSHSVLGLPPSTVENSRGDGEPRQEGTILLQAATRMAAQMTKPRASALEFEEKEALVRLRREMHLLFSAMTEIFPDLALQPRKDESFVPAWNEKANLEARTRPRGPGPEWERPIRAETIYLERLNEGVAWEEQADSYFAFVRQCLGSDLPADQHFFQAVLRIIGPKAQRETFSRKGFGREWRAAGEAMAKDRSLGVQVGGALILCQAGAPVSGMEIFQAHRDLIAQGKLSPEYMTEAFTMGPMVEYPSEPDPAQSLSKAVGLFKDVMVFLLNANCELSSEVVWKTGTYRFSEKQAAELLAAFRRYEAGRPESRRSPHWTRAADDVTKNLAKRAGEKMEEAPPQAVDESFPLPVADTSLPAPLEVDHAWVARNIRQPKVPGAIHYALPAGGKIWLQVEYAASEHHPARRQFVSLELPALEGRVVYEDEGISSSAPDGRNGPSFASDGEGIYFWNGRGISYARGKESRVLNVPELSAPYLWLIGKDLYAADREGVLLRIDPAANQYEILASQRRRPPQSVLDEERELSLVYRIYSGVDGSLSVNLHNRKICAFRPPPQGWEIQPHQWGNPGGARLLALLEGAWDMGGPFPDEAANWFFEDRAGPAPKGKPPDFFPAGRYLKKGGNDVRGKKLSFVKPQTGVISEGIFWSLLMEDERCWLLKLELSSGSFVCHPLDFSPEYQAWVDRARGRSVGERRLIPTREGVVIYAPNEPVLWFLPQSEIPPIDSTP